MYNIFNRVMHGRRSPRRIIGNQRGLTLIELLVASVIGLIVVGSAFKLYLTQHQTWLIQDEVTDAQQAARASVKMLSKHIRMAGYGLPSGISAIEAADANPDTLMVINQATESWDVYLGKDMPLPSAELSCNGYDVSCFSDGGWAYIYDPVADIGEYFLISHVQPDAAHLQHNTMPLSQKYPKGSKVIPIEALRFFIDNSDSLHPMLMVEKIGQRPEPFAEDIENLQFRYVMQNADTLDIPNQASLVRQVLVTITARTSRTDLQFEDEYRHREFATQVQVRNLGYGG
ncbi:prepilin-type N-terminal cleavage/methylation domain-containing protein [Candidatus Zixiibacteriota bacterium]